MASSFLADERKALNALWPAKWSKLRGQMTIINCPGRHRLAEKHSVRKAPPSPNGAGAGLDSAGNPTCNNARLYEVICRQVLD